MNEEMSVVAIVENQDLNQYNGYFTARIKDSGVIEPVVMTTPIGSHPVTSRYYRYSGLYGLPTEGSEIIIKKVSNSKYWYFDSVVSVKTKVDIPPADVPVMVDQPWVTGSQVDLGASFGDTSHQLYSQIMGLMSPEGNYLALDDTSNEVYRRLGARLVSKVKQRLTMNTYTGIVALENQKGDGMVITSPGSTSRYGDRRITTKAKGSITTKSTNASLTFRVGAGGRVIDINNKAIRGYNTNNTPTDIDTGSVNISSQHNDITIKLHSLRPSDHVGRIFIDASEAGGLVSIKAGSAGVEVYTEGDMNFLSEGAINIRAKKDITIKSDSNIQLNPTSEVPKPTLDAFAKDNQTLEEESAQN